ncbi:uncharacterized protein LOC143039498 [Oratosquilla oratoria]|uniref:uncharacterized protein LOC143039498 n=1 Tax=Oratosquilla oratoria TaxID=337810 RepID=UPI003F75D7FE
MLIQVEGQYLYRGRIQPRLPPYRSTRYPQQIPYNPPQGYNPYLQHQRRYDNFRNYGARYQAPLQRTYSQPIASSIVPPPTFLPSSTLDLQRTHPFSSRDIISQTPHLSQNANVQGTSYGGINTGTSSGPETQISNTYDYSIRRDDTDDLVKASPHEDMSDAQVYLESGAKYIPVNDDDDGDFHQNAHESSDPHRSSMSEVEFHTNNDIATRVQTGYKSHSTALDSESDEIVKYSNGDDNDRKGQSTGPDNIDAQSMDTYKNETEKEENNSNGYSEIKDVQGKKIQSVDTIETELPITEITTLFSEESPAKSLFVIASSTEESVDDINQTILQPHRQLISETGRTDEMTQVNENDTEKEFSNTDTLSSTSEKKDVCCNDRNSESGSTDKQETTQSSTQDEVHYKSVIDSSSELEKDGIAYEKDKQREEILIAGETVYPKISQPPLQHALASEQVQEPVKIEHENLNFEVKDSYTSKDTINEHTEEGYVGNEMSKEKEEIFIIDDNPMNEQITGPHEFLHHIMDDQTQKPYVAEQQADDEIQDLEFKQKDALDEPATEHQVVKDNKDDLNQDSLHFRSHLMDDETPKNHEALPQYAVVQEAQKTHTFSEQTPYRPTASTTAESDPSESNLERPFPDTTPSHTLQHSPEYVESNPSHHNSPMNPISPSTRIPPNLYPSQTQFLQPYHGRNYQRLPSVHAKNSTSIPLGPTNPQHSQQTSTPLLSSQKQNIFHPISVSAPNLPSRTPSILPPQFNTTFYPQSLIHESRPHLSLRQPPPQPTFHRSPASHQHSSPSLYNGMNRPAPPRFPSARHPVVPFTPQNHHNPNIHQQQPSRPPSNIHQTPTANRHPQSPSVLKSPQTVPAPNTYQQLPNTQDPLVHPDTVFYRSQHPPPFHTLMSPSGQLLYPALGPVPGPAPVFHFQSSVDSPENDHLPKTHYFQVRTISDQEYLTKSDLKSNDQEPDFNRKELSSELHEGRSEASYGEHFSSRDGLKSQGTTFSFSHNIHPQNSQINTQQTPVRRSQEVPLYHPPASHQLVNDTSIYQSPDEQSLHKQPRQQNYHLSPQQHNFLHQPQNPPANHNEDNLPPYFPLLNSTHFTLTPKQSASDFQPHTRIHPPQPTNSKHPPFLLHQPRPQQQIQRTKLPPPVVMAEDNLKTVPDLAKSQVEVLPQFNPASKRVFRLNTNPLPQKESIKTKAPNDDPFTIISGPSSHKNEEQIHSPVSESLILTSGDNSKTNLASDTNPVLNEDQSKNLSLIVLDVNETRKDNLLANNYDSSLSPDTTEETSKASVKITTPRSFLYTFEVGNNSSAVTLEDDFIYTVPFSGSKYHETDINQESKLHSKGTSILTHTQNQQDSNYQNKEEITIPANIEKAATLRTQGSSQTANENKEIHTEHKGTGFIIEYDDSIDQSSKTPKNYTNQHNQDIAGNTNRSQLTLITSHSDVSLSDNSSSKSVPHKTDRPFIIPSAHANPLRPVIIPKDILHRHKQPHLTEESEQSYTTVPLQSHNETSEQQRLPLPPTPQTNPTQVIHQDLLKELASNSPVPSHALPMKPLTEKSQQELLVAVINAQLSSLQPNTHAGDKQIQEPSNSYQDQQIRPQLRPITDEPQPSTQEPPSPHTIPSLQNLSLQHFSQHQPLPTQESSQISNAQLQSSSDFPSKQVKEPTLKHQLQSASTSLMPHSTLDPLTNLKPHQQDKSPLIQTKPVIIHHPQPPQPSLLPQLPSNTQTVDESFKIHLPTNILPYTPSEEDKFHLPGRDIVNHGIYGIPDNATEVRSDTDVTKKSKAGEVMHKSLYSLPDFLKDAIVIDNSLAEPLQVKMSQSYGKVTYN